jgi:type I restriction enzyme S subunit
MGSEWPTPRLKDVCSKIGSGATPKGGSSVYQDDGEFALIRSQNVRNDACDHNGLAFIESHHAEKLANVEVEERDVLLNITGDSVARCC